jgi:SAM-dependent methyltransferase
VAAAKANGLAHAYVSDVQSLDIASLALEEGTFDAVFSNAALHWCKRSPLGVLQSAHRALKPGGRFVAELGGAGNCIGVCTLSCVWGICLTMPALLAGLRAAIHEVLRRRGYAPEKLDPWFFPSIETYRQLLLSASFHPLSVSLFPRLTPLPAGLLEWLRLFVGASFLREMGEEEREEVMREVVRICEVDCWDEREGWGMCYVRLRVEAVRD